MWWANRSIRQKVLLVFMVAASVPLVLINVVWLRSSQKQLKDAAASQQSLLVSTSATRISNFLDSELSGATNHAQIQSLINFDATQARINLLQYAILDNNAVRIALVDNAGTEKVVIKNHELATDLKNIKETDAFNVVRYHSNEASVSKVFYENAKPRITISVPLLSYSKLGAQTLTSAQAIALRTGSDTRGALVVDISLDSLWQSVLTTKLGKAGYAYIVDGDGNLIAYNDQNFIRSHPNIASTQAVQTALLSLRTKNEENLTVDFHPVPEVTSSERGVQVLSSHNPVVRTGWAIIGEEPISSVYSAVSNAKKLALLILGSSLALVSILVYVATRSIIRPIQQLTLEAVRMGKGNFSSKLAFKGTNELSLLAQTFNKMGESIETLLNRYREQNLELSVEQAKLKIVLDTITDGIIALNQKFEISLANKTIVALGMYNTADQLIKKPWLKMFNLYVDGKPFDNSLLENDIMHFKNVEMKINDVQKYIDLTVVALPHAPNGMAYILTVHDTTASRDLENMRLDFVSMAAHELRTPLTAIRGYLSLLSEDYTKSTQHYVERAKSSAESLANLINNMLSLSKIERNDLKLNKANEDLVDIIKTGINGMRVDAKAKNIKLRTKLPKSHVLVYVDRLALSEVIGNLISNAIHYTTNGGTITVTVEVLNKIVKTTVQDTGIGIPLLAVGKLFTKYYRVGGGLTTNSQGTGIGLFICKTIVNAHSGIIGAESVLGKGSSFYFELPLSVAINSPQKTQSDDTLITKGNETD